MNSIARTIGKYRLMEPLGQGGFSTVYRAEHMSLGNEVALKILRSELAQDETFVRRFRREARRTVLLDHPNIVRVLDLDQVDGQLFIAMEYVPSQDLHDILIKERLLPLDRAVGIIRQLASALDYAHRRGLVHRDVKPGNVLVREDGVVKLTDFGLVKASEASQLTQTGTTLGTPAYMSPEQTRGEPVDSRADLYALGVMAYEFVTGRVPFQGDTPVSVVYMHVHETPPLPSLISQRASGPVEPVLLKALSKNPADRYQTGSALANALSEAIYALDDNSPSAAYNRAVELLEVHQFEEALELLLGVQAAEPGYRDTVMLIQKARDGQQLVKLYGEAAHHLSSARQLASQIAAADPAFPDTQKVLAAVQDPMEADPEEAVLAQCFDDGLTAYRKQHWLKAQEMFSQVVREQAAYSRSGQLASELLAEARSQLVAKRKSAASTLLRYIGRAAVVLLIVFIMLAGLHLLLFRPAIEEAVFDLIEPSLSPMVAPTVFRKSGQTCINQTESGMNQNLAQTLRDANMSGLIEVQLEEGYLSANADVGNLTASIGAAPIVSADAGILEIEDFEINWLLQLFFSTNGLRNFIERYVNDTVLKDGQMWLDQVTIREGSFRICVSPR